jgi:hypothetical protein
MSEPTTYEIVIRGRASPRLLRPLVDDFTIEHPGDGTTHLVGPIRDTSHLHGVLTHLTSVSAALISVAPAPMTGHDGTDHGGTDHDGTDHDPIDDPVNDPIQHEAS